MEQILGRRLRDAFYGLEQLPSSLSQNAGNKGTGALGPTFPVATIRLKNPSKEGMLIIPVLPYYKEECFLGGFL